MDPSNLIDEALGGDASAYARLKAKFDNFTITNAESAELNQLRRRIERYKKRAQGDVRLTDFGARAAELLSSGVKRSTLLRLVRNAGTNAAPAGAGEVVASFPEFPVQGKPFGYVVGKRYGARGDAAQAYANMKKRGYDFFVQHLTDFGKSWISETKMVGERGRGGGNKQPRKVNDSKIRAIFA